MERKIPTNPRYAHVGSRLDTGLTVDKVRSSASLCNLNCTTSQQQRAIAQNTPAAIDAVKPKVKYVTAKEYLKRRDEPHYRVTPGQLADLLSEYEQDQQEGVQDIDAHRGIDGNGPVVVTYDEEAVAVYDRPYLIIDLRPPEEFARYRVTQARSFPVVLLNQDRMTAELFRYRNKDGCLIILYDDEERAAVHAAQTLLHRVSSTYNGLLTVTYAALAGFDNLYVLTGGLQAFCELHPNYIEGTLPEPKVQPRGSTSSSSNRGTPQRRRSTGSTIAGSVRGSVTPSRAGGSTTAGSVRGSIATRNSMSRMSSSQQPVTPGDRFQSFDTTSRTGSSKTPASAAGTGMMRASMRTPVTANHETAMSQRSTMSVAESVISRATARRGR
eukprot:17771-Heterococcus_DN1.PRE.1